MEEFGRQGPHGKACTKAPQGRKSLRMLIDRAARRCYHKSSSGTGAKQFAAAKRTISAARGGR
jgi:hypothetical protein